MDTHGCVVANMFIKLFGTFCGVSNAAENLRQVRLWTPMDFFSMHAVIVPVLASTEIRRPFAKTS